MVLVHSAAPGAVLAAALGLGFLSDVLDGVVAHRTGAVTPFAGSTAASPVTLAAGMLAQAETLAITLVRRGWRHDVPSIWNALRIPA